MQRVRNEHFCRVSAHESPRRCRMPRLLGHGLTQISLWGEASIGKPALVDKVMHNDKI